MEQIYTPKQNYKVLVRCFTYNQSKYIEDALNGFAMQKTDFPFICLVMDDCSTDGEQEVIKAWMERECDMDMAEYIEIELSVIILVPHKTNTNCTLAFYFLKQNLYGTGDKKMKMVYPWREHCEYEAICEGDDYWTNPLKLQTQVLFLDKHNSHSMCFHAVDYLYPNGEKKRVERYSEDLEACNMEDVIKFGGNYAKLNTIMIRLSMFKNGYNDWAANCPVGDLPSVLTLFVNGKVAYLKKTMSVYRCDASGSWTKSMDNQMQKTRNHYHKIIDMWMAFDNWTGKQYHREISSKIRTNRWQYYKGVIAMIINKTKIEYVEKSKVKKTGRLPYLDIAKGILILCVIYSHICWASSLMDVIIGDTWQNLNKIGTHLWVPFYMPAFFIITGVCSSFDKEFKVFLQNNCITLLWPMLVITFQNHWFVYALFISKLLYYGLNKLVRNSVALWILYFVITIVACVCQNSPEIASHNRWYMLHGLSLAIYIPIGQKLRLYIDKKWLFVLSSLVYLIVILASCITNWNLPSVFSKYDVELQQLPLHFLLSVTGSLMLIGLCKLIKHNKILEYLGRNSLVIFFVHVIFITKLVTYLPFNTSNELHFFGVFIASTVLSCIVAAIFDTKYLKWCLGKF